MNLRYRPQVQVQLACRPQVRAGILVVDCAACKGEGSLGDARCLQAFLCAVPPHETFAGIILRRQIEVRYQPAASTLLRGAAEMVREFRGIYPSTRRSCARCDFRPEAVVLRAILSNWGFHSATRKRPARKRCSSCPGCSGDMADAVEGRLRALEAKAMASIMITKDG
jgi:hypothetical protein